MGTFWSNLSILFWCSETLFCSLVVASGDLVLKVAFFTWEATWGKVLTSDQIQRREFYLANKCLLCHFEVEMVDHILLHCAKSRVLWHLLFSIFGVSWVLPCLIMETLLGWHGSFMGKVRKKTWEVTPFIYILDNVEEKELVSAWQWGIINPKIKKFFCM